MPRKTDSNNPADWLFIAGSEMEGVSALVKSQISHAMCRSKLAEIVEKVIKAELIRRGWFLERTHDLEKLNDELRKYDSQLADELQSLVEELAEAYLSDRYPGFDLDEPDWARLDKQTKEVAAALAKVKARVEAK